MDPRNSSDFLDQTIDFEPLNKGWDTLADCLQALSDAWESHEADQRSPELKETVSITNRPRSAPNLSDFLPDTDEALRAVALIELIKLDMECRSKNAHTWKPLEEYRVQFPELCTGGQLPADLVYDEFQLRKQMDGGASQEEYQQRFPGEFNSLTRLLNDGTKNTSSLYKPDQVQFAVGDRVDDFDLLTRLGKGAFATVFLARQNSMQRLVALKISADQGSEPQMLAQLDHPHIVRVYDQRVIKDPAARLMYMQHVAGGTLQEVFSEARRIAEDEELCGKHLIVALDNLLQLRGESIPVKSENRKRMARSTWDQAVSQIGVEIAEALAYAHGQNVLHRDLKPANVLLDKDCHVKLVDFNTSFCSKLDGATPAAYFGGSLAYMSPEQLEACSPDHERQPDALDGRSDLFSVGVMMYELLVGCRPFVDKMKPGDWSGSLQTMISDRYNGLSDEALARLQSHNKILSQAIVRCLNGTTDARFSDGEALQANLTWARNSDSDELFKSRSDLLSRFILWTPLGTVSLLTIGISFTAVLFIATYNLDVSVPEPARLAQFGGDGFFGRVMLFANLALFAVAGLAIFVLTRPICKVLSAYKKNEPISPEQINNGIKRNLDLGQYGALMSALEWTVGGIIYPAAFFLFGYVSSGGGKMTFDFVSSHLLAGLIVGAYTFWSITFCALHIWQPKLLEAALKNDGQLDWSGSHQQLKKQCGFYHALASAIPIIAIAWIVWVSDHETDERSLTALSIVALFGLFLLVWTSRRVNYLLDLQAGFNPEQDA